VLAWLAALLQVLLQAAPPHPLALLLGLLLQGAWKNWCGKGGVMAVATCHYCRLLLLLGVCWLPEQAVLV
jgi:hypothetical protein